MYHYISANITATRNCSDRLETVNARGLQSRLCRFIAVVPCSCDTHLVSNRTVSNTALVSMYIYEKDNAATIIYKGSVQGTDVSSKESDMGCIDNYRLRTVVTMTITYTVKMLLMIKDKHKMLLDTKCIVVPKSTENIQNNDRILPSIISIIYIILKNRLKV